MRFYCTASSGSSALKFLPGMEGAGRDSMEKGLGEERQFLKRKLCQREGES